jgi:hypothetical protein
MRPSAFSASIAAGYAGFLSTFITRGIELPDAAIALAQKAFGCGCVAFGREQKIDRLPDGIERSIQTCPRLSPLYMSRRFDSACWPASSAAGSVCSTPVHIPHPTPIATGIKVDTKFGYQLCDMFVTTADIGDTIARINDHFSRVRAPLERIVWSDRHGLLPLCLPLSRRRIPGCCPEVRKRNPAEYWDSQIEVASRSS